MPNDPDRVFYWKLGRLYVSAACIKPIRKLPLVRAWYLRTANGDLHGLLRVHKLVFRYWWRRS